MTSDGVVEILIDGTFVGQVALVTQEFWTPIPTIIGDGTVQTATIPNYGVGLQRSFLRFKTSATP